MNNSNSKMAQFNETLTALVELAASKGNRLNKAEISAYFQGILEDAKMVPIYDYLLENHITIEDYIPAQTTTKTPSKNSPGDVKQLNEREQYLMDMYMEDLEQIQALSSKWQPLLEAFLAQGKPADKPLIEACLPLVTHCIEKYQNQGVSTMDLIQEGNLGLIEGILTYEKSMDFLVHVSTSIEHALKDAINEQIASSRIDSHLVQRANLISDATCELAEKLEREPTLEELAAHLSLSEEEIQTVMKISLDALNTTE